MLSIPHLIIIFVVALVVFGPEKLPELARNLGKVLGEFRRATGELRNTFEGHLHDLEREAEQRRIGGSAVPATPSTPPEGVVATDAPYTPGMTSGKPGTERLQTEHSGVNKTESNQTEVSRAETNRDDASNRESNQREIGNENVSDGGTRPA